MIKKIKIYFAKLLIFNIDYQPFPIPKWLNIILSILVMGLIGCVPVYLGFISNHLLLGILFAVAVIFSLYNVSIVSQVRGAEYALHHPPKVGETKIDLRVDDEIIWHGENFIFQPPDITLPTDYPKAEDNPFTSEKEVNKGGRPKGHLSAGSLSPGQTVNDILPFLRTAKETLERKDGSFTQLCKEAGHNESTVRDWLNRYKNEIDNYEKP